MKTKENTMLIVDLNNLKFENKKQQENLEVKKKEKDDLQRQLDEMRRKEQKVKKLYNDMIKAR